MMRCALAWALACLFVGCTGRAAESELGSLTVALKSHAGGADYRLERARFALEGPESRGLSVDGDEELSIELAAGSYTLTLLDGWALEQVGGDAGTAREVSARLVSENPMTLTILPGEATVAVLRFELATGAALTMERGSLRVLLEIDTDGGTGPFCEGALRISELDYEQAGNDDAEFVEVVNAGVCAAPLSGVLLELVNGGDGEVYARYELDDAASELGPGELLLLADPALLQSVAVPGARLPLRGSGLQNGPDGVRLVRGARVLDSVAYEGQAAGAHEGSAAPADRGEQALARCPHGFDSDANALDFVLLAPSPLADNPCLE